MSDEGLTIVVLLTIITLIFYFIPTIVASHRGHHQMMAIFVLNLFTGFTFVGWVAALVWASTKVQQVQITNPERREPRL